MGVMLSVKDLVVNYGAINAIKGISFDVQQGQIVTLIGSMLLTNDTALLTFLPLSWMVLQEAGQEKLTAYVFILQNCAANLGGMLTPFGNPQNLYLFDHYHIPVGEFLSIMLLPFALSTGLILLCCLLIPRQVLAVPQRELTLDKPRAIAYGLLFCLAVGMVLRAVPYPVGLAVIAASLAVMDPRALKSVDWGLLVTFAAFFVFSGNMARIQPVRELFGRLLAHGVLPVSALTCQVISNVPAAMLLSGYSSDLRELIIGVDLGGLGTLIASMASLISYKQLVGVNVGGAGTLVASLASLITFREYTRRCPEQTVRFLGLFTLISFSFLAILLAALSL